MKTYHAILLALLAFSTPATAADRVVEVTGAGEVKTEPDLAKVSLGVFVFEKDLLAAKREADRKIAALLDAAAKLDIARDDVQTTQLYVNPKYDKGDESFRFLGYEITRSMTVTLRKIDRLNDLLERSIQAGANRIEEIELATSKETELRDRARALAIACAKDEAGRLAAGFGAKLGPVLSISAKAGGGGMRFNVLAAPAFPEAKYQPGVISVSVDLDVVFSLTD